MRAYNFLRAFEDRFVYEPGLLSLILRAGITANASAVDIWKTRKGAGQKAWKVLRE
jgi:hypothetical protein